MLSKALEPGAPPTLIHAAKLLRALQRHTPTPRSARDLRRDVIRATWADRDTLATALNTLVGLTLVARDDYLDTCNRPRARYQITPAGQDTAIHPTYLTATPSSRPQPPSPAEAADTLIHACGGHIGAIVALCAALPPGCKLIMETAPASPF